MTGPCYLHLFIFSKIFKFNVKAFHEIYSPTFVFRSPLRSGGWMPSICESKLKLHNVTVTDLGRDAECLALNWREKRWRFSLWFDAELTRTGMMTNTFFLLHAAACYSVERTLVFEQVRRRRQRCDARPTWWILITQSTHTQLAVGGEKETLVYSSSPVPRISIFTSCGRDGASVGFLSEGTFFCRVLFIPLLFPPSFDTTPWRTYASRAHLTGRGKHTKTSRLYPAQPWSRVTTILIDSFTSSCLQGPRNDPTNFSSRASWLNCSGENSSFTIPDIMKCVIVKREE